MYLEYLSNCCSARPIQLGDNDSVDYGICPSCGEHCEFEQMALEEEFDIEPHSDADPGL